MRIIEIERKGEVFQALFDEQDLPLFENKKLFISSHGYVVYNDNGIKYAHKLISKGELVDHINQNKLDNTRANLRPVTRSQNRLNSSKTKGVYEYKDGRKNRFQAKIEANGTVKRKGFETYEEAERWRNEQLKNFL